MKERSGMIFWTSFMALQPAPARLVGFSRRRRALAKEPCVILQGRRRWNRALAIESTMLVFWGERDNHDAKTRV